MDWLKLSEPAWLVSFLAINLGIDPHALTTLVDIFYSTTFIEAIKSRLTHNRAVQFSASRLKGCELGLFFSLGYGSLFMEFFTCHLGCERCIPKFTRYYNLLEPKLWLRSVVNEAVLMDSLRQIDVFLQSKDWEFDGFKHFWKHPKLKMKLELQRGSPTISGRPFTCWLSNSYPVYNDVFMTFQPRFTLEEKEYSNFTELMEEFQLRIESLK